jgi:hypothetical protein
VTGAARTAIYAALVGNSLIALTRFVVAGDWIK